MDAFFRGAGWGLERGREPGKEPGVFFEAEEGRIHASLPEQLPDVLTALDEIVASGDPHRIAAGFISYEAGVSLEGSTALVRAHEFLPFAEFSVFDTRRRDASRGAGSSPLFTFKESSTAERSLSSNEWASCLEAIRAGIARGDVYQVNLSRRTRFTGSVDPFALAAALYDDNPVPFALTLANDGWGVVMNSPELFLNVDLPALRVVTKPIKGTTARGEGEGEDRRRREALLASSKDAAENVMIVDLLRNDLGKVALAGSVETTGLRLLRSFRHLHHLESTVEARLRPGVKLSDVLLAALPPGSVTGAPKRAALGFIHALEPVARGAYCGVAGFVRGDGRAVFAVAIRTAILGRATVDYHAGGGIVWDSRADAEEREADTKSVEFGAALAALFGKR